MSEATQSKITTADETWYFSEVRIHKKRGMILSIEANKLNANSVFHACEIKASILMSFIAGYKNFKIIGKKSRFSEILLRSKNARFLLNYSNSHLGLDEKGLYYKAIVPLNYKEHQNACFECIMALAKELNETL